MLKTIGSSFLLLSLCGWAPSEELSALPPSDSVCYNLVNGLPNLYLDPMTEKIGCTWQGGVVYDKPLIQKFYSLLASEDKPLVVIDVGAQTGSFSLLAKYLPNSRWYAFEPLEEAANTLKTNLSLNAISNVSVHPFALSDFSGQATLQMPEMGAWGLATIGPYPLRFAPTGTRPVDCIDLDSFVIANSIEKVDFMKLDTEGSELFILRGAKNLILRDHPVILMEYNESSMAECLVRNWEIDTFLEEMGYEWKFISTEDILCIPIPPQS